MSLWGLTHLWSQAEVKFLPPVCSLKWVKKKEKGQSNNDLISNILMSDVYVSISRNLWAGHIRVTETVLLLPSLCCSVFLFLISHLATVKFPSCRAPWHQALRHSHLVSWLLSLEVMPSSLWSPRFTVLWREMRLLPGLSLESQRPWGRATGALEREN